MMSDIKIIEITKGSQIMDQVEDLFADLYDYMEDTGLQMPLVDGGEKKWRNSIEKLVGGRFGILLGAISNEKLIGFSHGAIRYSADYLGGLMVGYITHLFVMPEFRSSRIGYKLLSDVEDWFDSKGVHSYELQVLCDNSLGIRFWEKMGYKRELLQMRKSRN